MKYWVFFEIGGKKLKCLVEANSEEDAKYKIYGKIKFIKVKKEVNDEAIFDFLKGFNKK